MSLAQGLRDVIDVARNILPLTAYSYRGRPTPCPICGAASHHPVAGLDRRLKRLTTVMCDACGLFFSNPMPTEAELERYYRRLYRLDYQLMFSPGNRHVRKRQREAARRVNVISRLLPAGARSLDFGAGSGEFVLAMLLAGFDAHGFDPGESYAAHARAQLGDRVTTRKWQDVDEPASFDIVTSYHVFEHLVDPVAALRAAASWVKSGGLVHLIVPDATRLLQKKGFGSLHFAHVIGFNRYNLQLIGALTGLTPIRMTGSTDVVFRKSEHFVDPTGLAKAGAALSQETVRLYPVGGAYLRHHLGKVLRVACR